MSFLSVFRNIFFFLVALFLLVSYSVYQMNVSEKQKDAAVEHQEELRLLGEQLADGSDYLTSEIKRYVQFGNRTHHENYWREINKTRSRDKVVARLKELNVFPGELVYIETAKEYSDNLIKTEQVAMEAVESGNFEKARKQVFGAYYDEQKSLIMENIQEFQDVVNKRAAGETKEAQSRATFFMALTNGLLFLSGTSVLFLVYFTGIRQLVEPIKRFTALMLELAQGNLGINIPDISQKNEIGDMVSALNIFKDKMIRQKEAEETLRLSEERFRTMFEEAPLGVVLIDSLTGCIYEVNSRFAEIIGREREEMVGSDCLIVTHPDDMQEDIDKMAALNAGEIPGFNMNKRYIKPDGSHVWVSMTVAPITVGKTHPRHLRMIENITHRKQAEEELQRHRNHLEELVDERTQELKSVHNQLLHVEKLSALGKLTGTIAHEFNNPIYGVRNIMEQILEGYSLDEEGKSLLKLGVKECNRMADLIRGLQDFYKPSAMMVSSLDINKVVDEVVLLTNKSFKRKKIKLEKKYYDNLPKVEAVEDQLKQVFLNIIQNAIDAIPDDGGTMSISTEEFDSNVRVRTQDTGEGMSEEQIKTIFDPFYSTKGVKGTGLGLSVSYGIVKKHGGSIEVESTPGKGSVFMVNLPIKGNSL